MNTLERTDEFNNWLIALRDNIAKARILSRIRLAELGNFGDSEPVGSGVSEMRIHVGAGYRVYYAQSGETIYLLLSGGNKSTQKKDIKNAISMWKGLKP
jgi:putative addiction module killer protein